MASIHLPMKPMTQTKSLSDDPITVLIAIIFTLITVLLRNITGNSQLWPTSTPIKSGNATDGPQEGGWWYPAGTPVQSIFLSDQSAEEYVEARKWEDIKGPLRKSHHQLHQRSRAQAH